MNDFVKVFAPASVANLACGFDILGLAIEHPGDEIIARKSNHSGLRISKITGDNGLLPLDIEKNTAGYAAKQLMITHGCQNVGVELEIHKKMPFGSGLGSSAASAAGAVFAISELLSLEISKREMLASAVLGEQRADGAYHADNVAPALLGGIVLIRDNTTLDIIELPVPEQLYVSVAHPEIEILTKEARNILSSVVLLNQHVKQNGNLGAFVAGLYKNDYELISRSMNDHIIEPQRKKLIPWFDDLKSTLIKTECLGTSISGSGPSIFALSKGAAKAEKVHQIMESFFQNLVIEHQVYTSKINCKGAHRI